MQGWYRRGNKRRKEMERRKAKRNLVEQVVNYIAMKLSMQVFLFAVFGGICFAVFCKTGDFVIAILSIFIFIFTIVKNKFKSNYRSMVLLFFLFVLPVYVSPFILNYLNENNPEINSIGSYISAIMLFLSFFVEWIRLAKGINNEEKKEYEEKKAAYDDIKKRLDK